jgi:pilus assembly protein CpaF
MTAFSRAAACADRLLKQITTTLRMEELEKLAADRREEEIRRAVAVLLDRETDPLEPPEREQVTQIIVDEVLGLGPLEELLRDPTVTDILVNAPDEVYIEREGVLEESPVRFRDGRHVRRVIERIVGRVGRRIDDLSPLVDARLPDGSRVNAVIPPLAVKSPTLSVRRFGERPLQLDDLLARDTLTSEMADFLNACVRAKLNIIISGGTGTGKTTLLNVLSRAISQRERVITIEDTVELRLQQRHVVGLESRPPNLDGKGEVTMRHLVRNALRMRPDRIIVGECRGGEALDMLQAMNTGHEGSMTTLHANSPRDALTRLETMLMMGGVENLPIRVMRRMIVSAINLLVHVDRMQGGGRKISEITEVVGMEGDIITTQELFVFSRQGVDEQGRARGWFETTGVRPKFAERLKSIGVDLPVQWFQRRTPLGQRAS